PKELIREIGSLVKKAVVNAGHKLKAVDAVSIGAPGPVDVRHGIVREAANLGWKNVPLAADLNALLEVPIVVDNDVNVGVVGEHALGAGEKVPDLVGIFIGTGIGGGIISGGKLFGGSNGWAGEVGHTVVLPDGPVCSCGRRGHVEALASRPAMERAVLAAIESGRTSVVSQILQERGRDRITSSVIQEALARKDPLMQEVLEQAQYYLGILVANVTSILDPERVVIGGGIAARLGETFVGPIRKTAAKYFAHAQAGQYVKIVPAILGDDAGALGAVVLARHRLRL
ncbi:MAG TPA: ROK family protein, partial [Terriglobia bacterium]|nr:ROK family protein [Terriglobia bacterium]